MDLHISLKKILEKGSLSSEPEFQRASAIYRQFRLIVKDHPELAKKRKQLFEMIIAYEDEISMLTLT